MTSMKGNKSRRKFSHYETNPFASFRESANDEEIESHEIYSPLMVDKCLSHHNTERHSYYMWFFIKFNYNMILIFIFSVLILSSHSYTEEKVFDYFSNYDLDKDGLLER